MDDWIWFDILLSIFFCLPRKKDIDFNAREGKYYYVSGEPVIPPSDYHKQLARMRDEKYNKQLARMRYKQYKKKFL
tara:strand:+ start:1880 stop:2107 length:228 start_codon:yes stop_codon:yes gene_type:complete